MNDITIMPDGRMTAANAARYLNLSYRTLANYRTKGNGPRFVKRGVIYYYQKDLDEWLSGGLCRSTAEARLKTQPHLIAMGT